MIDRVCWQYIAIILVIFHTHFYCKAVLQMPFLLGVTSIWSTQERCHIQRLVAQVHTTSRGLQMLYERASNYLIEKRSCAHDQQGTTIRSPSGAKSEHSKRD